MVGRLWGAVMTNGKQKAGPIRLFVVLIALSVAFGPGVTFLHGVSAQDQKGFGATPPFKRMPPYGTNRNS